jgi:1-aminocyclopropane-1-carboxylate deaminase/D-cysteine desulfhydrase-like pyridoxal-dependent ACC family enzyme
VDPESLTASELRRRLERVPRERLAVLPTGMQNLRRLADALGIPGFHLKRDDLTGLGLGGNKARGLEFILADARSKGCDVLVAGGGVEQSNHAVQCVAAANKLGLDAVIVLRARQPSRRNGNALLHELLGGRTVWVDADPEIRDRGSVAADMHRVADELRESGWTPYVLESSLHRLSVLGYVNAVLELRAQLPDSPARVYVTSEGAALGGLMLGSILLQLPWTVRGLAWRPTEEGTPARLANVVQEAARLLGLEAPLAPEDFVIRESGGPSYGVGNPASWKALELAARSEGLVLDPVYTAKGLAGLIADLAEKPVLPGTEVVFIHTGGVGAVFAYEEEIRREILEAAAVGGGGRKVVTDVDR